MAAATNPVIVTGTTPVLLVRLIKAELMEIQCVLTVSRSLRTKQSTRLTLKKIEENYDTKRS